MAVWTWPIIQDIGMQQCVAVFSGSQSLDGFALTHNPPAVRVEQSPLPREHQDAA